MRSSPAILTISLLVLTSSLRAGVEPVGSEFQVNTYTTAYQYQPSVAMEADGDFVVVWTSLFQDGSSGGVFGQRFDSSGMPLGGEFLVNTYTTSRQSDPAIGMDSDGNFVVAWNSASGDGSAYGVFGQSFDSAGARVGAQFQVNVYVTSDQAMPSLAGGASGDLVVVWESRFQDGSYRGVFGRRFDSAGLPLGGEFQVNTYTTGSQFGPSVAADPTGAFVVAWHSGYQNSASYDIFAQRFDSTGDPVGGEFRVNSYTPRAQGYPVVAMDGGGGFIVVWSSDDQDGSDVGVFGQRYDSAGNPLGAEFRANARTKSDQRNPAVAADSSGGFVVLWNGEVPGGSQYDVLGQRFDNGGARVGGEFQVNTYTPSLQYRPAVAMGSAGEFVVAWVSDGQDGSGDGVFGQRLVPRGPELTSPIEGGLVDCSDPVTIRPTLTWDDGGYDTFKVLLASDPGFVQGTSVSSGDGFMAITSWMPSVKKWRSACKKAMAADPVTPEMFIKVLGKDLDLPKGDPALKSSSTVVRVDVQP